MTRTLRLVIHLLPLLIISITACAPPPTPSPTSTSAATLQAEPADATAAPGLPLFAPLSLEPVFPHGGADSWYGFAVEPGAVIRVDDGFLLFFNGLNGWPAKTSVGVAASQDAVEWELLQEQPVLDAASEVFPGFTFFVSSVIQLSDSTWAMYLYTLNEGRDGAPGSILLATAPAPGGPWNLDPSPVLLPGPPGSWDASRVTQPHVIRIDGEYRMYFSGYETDRLQGARRIGVAFSADGRSWEKGQEPVFSFRDDPRAWDAFRVFQPRVVPLDSGFLMLYKSNISVGRSEGLGFAASQDGLSWEPLAVNPIITEDTYPVAWRRSGIADLISHDGRLLLFLEILEREGGGYHHGNADYSSNIYLLEAGLQGLIP